MTERRELKSRRIPGAGVPDTAACGQWETLLADALDGQLRAEDEGMFSSHLAGCSRCAAMLEEARRGREWLSFLSAEPAVPEGLLERILARTTPGLGASRAVETAGAATVPVAAAWRQTRPVTTRPQFTSPEFASPESFSPGFIRYAQRAAATRMMMTAAMAFFSLALTLNLGGVRLENLRLHAIRPTVVRANLERRLAAATVPVERYYDHLRVVHEVESSVRELRNNIDGESPDGKQKQLQPGGPGVSGGAGAAEQDHDRQDRAANEPALNEHLAVAADLTVTPELAVTAATAHGSGPGAGTRSSIWTA